MRDYLIERQEKTISKYGLLRRSEAVMRQFEQFIPSKPCAVLDIGTADGLMLHYLKENYDVGCLGVDYKFRYVKSAKERGLSVIQADGRKLPLRDNSFDIVIAAAVFKHVRGLEYLLGECHRLLRLSGKMIAIDATPLGIYLGLLFGHFNRGEIVQVLNLRATQQILIESGFKIIFAERFMLSPIPFIGSEALEKKLKQVHFTLPFCDQIICAECAS
jgi:SAM-dependent methyltransferase